VNAAAAERVLAQALALAQSRWGGRLAAAYAIGSLAHGGFSAHVSDIDLALILSDPLLAEDAVAMDRLARDVKGTGLPLAERLSVFWTALEAAGRMPRAGRMPPVDLLDLRQFGRLMCGRDVRSALPCPTPRELLVDSGEFALRRLATAQTGAYVADPSGLLRADIKTLTRSILLPVRLLFTAWTGRVGGCDSAVQYFCGVETGPSAGLVSNALAWRNDPPDRDAQEVAEVVHKGLRPLYRIFIDEYEGRLRRDGEIGLADAYRDWLARVDQVRIEV
jgi:hypothetical protein